MNQTAVAKPKKQEPSVEFVPWGASDKIKLTASMIANLIANPTKSGAKPSARDCVKFMMLCRGKRANPFEGDCYMIGYDSNDGPVFSMIPGQDLFLKRAEQSKDYAGIESGIILQIEGFSELIERAGTIQLRGEKLIGGWCKVHRHNQTHPTYKSVKFETYNTGKSRWGKDPEGMIEKVARSQALRIAYPTALGGFYSQEEMDGVMDAAQDEFEAKKPIAMPVEILETAEIIEPKKTESKKAAPLGDGVSEDKEPGQSTRENDLTPDDLKELLAARKQEIGQLYFKISDKEGQQKFQDILKQFDYASSADVDNLEAADGILTQLNEAMK